MNVAEYFDSVQEYVKQNIEDSSQIDAIIKDLNRDNIQAVINQDFNNNVSVEESGEKVLKQMVYKDKEEDQPIPNEIGGERGMNTMERKIVDFNDFLIKENISKSLKVYRVDDYGVDTKHYLVAANSVNEVSKILEENQYNFDWDSIIEIEELQTTLTIADIIIDF